MPLWVSVAEETQARTWEPAGGKEVEQADPTALRSWQASPKKLKTSKGRQMKGEEDRGEGREWGAQQQQGRLSCTDLDHEFGTDAPVIFPPKEFQ